MSLSCVACKTLKRRCPQNCVLAPYFDHPEKIEKVNQVYGINNVIEILDALNPTQRKNAVESLVYEAGIRIRDPIYGCLGAISHLQDERKKVKPDIMKAEDKLRILLGLSPMVGVPRPTVGVPETRITSEDKVNMEIMLGGIKNEDTLDSSKKEN